MIAVVFFNSIVIHLLLVILLTDSFGVCLPELSISCSLFLFQLTVFDTTSSAGNKKSLIDAVENGINLREEILQMYRENYHGGMMKLVVIGGGEVAVHMFPCYCCIY